MKVLLYLSMAFFLLAGQTAWAQMSKTIQGVAIDSKGVPLADGKRIITFTLYDSPDSENPLWSEQQKVVIEDGLFSVELGSVKSVNLPLDKPYWLGMAVGQDAELSPRMQLTPAAELGVDGVLVANNLDEAYDGGGSGAGRTITADAGAVNIEGAGGLTVEGNIGIGLTSKSAPLHIVSSSGNAFFADRYVDSPFAVGFVFRKARGTLATPATVLANDNIGVINMWAHDGSAYQIIGQWRNIAQTVSGSNISGKTEFRTSNTSGTMTTRMTIDEDGDVGIGETNPAAKLVVRGDSGTNLIEAYNDEGGSNLVFRVERTTGNVYADGSFNGGGADVAEFVPMSDSVVPGDVIEIDPHNPGKFRKTREAMSMRVAGIITTQPGVVLGGNSVRPDQQDGHPAVALAGRVPVKVMAKYGAIEIGDLLVSSPFPGYAMRCSDRTKAVGAIIGKAMEPLKVGTGKIMCQVMLR